MLWWAGHSSCVLACPYPQILISQICQSPIYSNPLLRPAETPFRLPTWAGPRNRVDGNADHLPRNANRSLYRPQNSPKPSESGDQVLVEKEVIRPGIYWYRDESSGVPRKLVATPELVKHWHDQGNAMLSAKLPIPVPKEHDFNAHPMTPAEKLDNNTGWVKEYRLKGDRLFSVLDIQDEEYAKKLPRTIRWTSPWFSSFTDGAGHKWDNVISHLALTTRPRIVDQQPFSSISAALSMATEVKVDASSTLDPGEGGFCLSLAGRLFTGKVTQRLRPRYPVAFSLWGGGIKLSDDDMPPKNKKSPKGPPKPPTASSKGGGGKPGESKPGETTHSTQSEETDEFDGDLPDEEMEEGDEEGGLMNPLAGASGDVKMEEILCDLLQALGVPMPDDSNEHEFKRHLYEAAMCKIKDLAAKGDPNSPQNTANKQMPGQTPNSQHSPARNPQNPLIQQEQQPMYMSLEDINKITDDTMRTIALSMYNENVKLRAEMEASKKTTDSLRDAKLKEASTARDSRIALLSRLSPRVKVDLATMVTAPSMALSMGDGGAVMDPMAQTLAILEKGLADLPRLLTTDSASLSVVPQPTDESILTEARADEIAESMARQMGCGPAQKKAS